MPNLSTSLIIPAYNEEKYLADCLTHALQSRQSFDEIIVVDNASTDGTAEVVKGFKNVRLVREDKKGLTQARQSGFLAASSDIVAYVDADTHMPVDWLERVVKQFDRNQAVVCVSGPYIYYDIPQWQQWLVRVYWYIFAVPTYHAVGCMVVGGNFAIRRATLEKMNGFDTTISFYGEDTNIARRASEYGKVKFIPSLAMPTSGRRLAGQGFWKTGWLYVINFWSEILRKKPASQDYIDIR